MMPATRRKAASSPHRPVQRLGGSSFSCLRRSQWVGSSCGDGSESVVRASDVAGGRSALASTVRQAVGRRFDRGCCRILRNRHALNSTATATPSRFSHGCSPHGLSPGRPISCLVRRSQRRVRGNQPLVACRTRTITAAAPRNCGLSRRAASSRPGSDFLPVGSRGKAIDLPS